MKSGKKRINVLHALKHQTFIFYAKRKKKKQLGPWVKSPHVLGWSTKGNFKRGFSKKLWILGLEPVWRSKDWKIFLLPPSRMKDYTFQSNSFNYITDHFYPSCHKLSLWKLSPPLLVIFYSMEQIFLKAFLLSSSFLWFMCTKKMIYFSYLSYRIFII